MKVACKMNSVAGEHFQLAEQKKKPKKLKEQKPNKN